MRIRLEDGCEVNPKYTTVDVDRHGNVRIYFRRHGRKVRLRDLSSVEAFMADYRMALDGAPISSPTRAASKGSLRWLVEKYYASAEFKALAESTRTVRRGILDAICELHGARLYKELEALHVRIGIRDTKADFPEAANAKVKALRQVYKWAVDIGHADKNPAKDVPYLKSNNPSGWHTWTEEEVRQFKDRHPIGTRPRLALALGLYSGVRRSDAVRLGRQMEREGWLYFTEKKGELRKPKDRALPILPELREAIDAMQSGHLTYLVTKFGRPFTVAGFGNWFRRRCNEAGLSQCSFHGLRKAGATIVANNGATEHQLMAMFGWDSPKQAALYTRQADRKRLTGDAMHLVVPGHTENESVPLSEVVSGSGTKKVKKA